jgi:glycosyltransferase involved in cell wall biosynthesis
MKQKICIQQQNLADYRLGFYQELKKYMNFDLICGKSAFAENQVSLSPEEYPFKVLNNTFIIKKNILIQSHHWRYRILCDLYVCEANVRTLSTWFILGLRWILNKRSVLWGHIKGRSIFSAIFLPLMRYFTLGQICYTNCDRERLQDIERGYPVGVAPNACMSVDYMAFNECQKRDSFVISGRLVEDKKQDLALVEFAKFSKFTEATRRVRLIIAGDGPMALKLRILAEQLGISDKVDFVGQIPDGEILRGIYNRSIASISAGYVGLAAIQSFGYGVPMIISRNEPHSPEIACCVEGFNCLYFIQDNNGSLAYLLKKVFDDRDLWRRKGPEIVQNMVSTHSFQAMAKEFSYFIEKLNSEA